MSDTETRAHVQAHEAAIRITLPIPPSVNQLYKNAGKRGRVATEAYTAWRTHAGLVARRFAHNPIVGPYVVYLALPKSLRGDIDNRIKAPIDLLVSLGITPDDRHCQGVAAWRHATVKAGSCEVLIDAVTA